MFRNVFVFNCSVKIIDVADDSTNWFDIDIFYLIKKWIERRRRKTFTGFSFFSYFCNDIVLWESCWPILISVQNMSHRSQLLFFRFLSDYWSVDTLFVTRQERTKCFRIDFQTRETKKSDDDHHDDFLFIEENRNISFCQW